MNLIPSPTGIGVGTVGGEGTSASSVHYRGNQQNSHKMFRRPQKHSYKPFFWSKMTYTSKQTPPKPAKHSRGEYLRLAPNTSIYQSKILSLYPLNSILFRRSLNRMLANFHFRPAKGPHCRWPPTVASRTLRSTVRRDVWCMQAVGGWMGGSKGGKKKKERELQSPVRGRERSKLVRPSPGGSEPSLVVRSRSR